MNERELKKSIYIERTRTFIRTILKKTLSSFTIITHRTPAAYEWQSHSILLCPGFRAELERSPVIQVV